MIDYNGFKEQDHRRDFDFFSNGFQSSSFPGTVIRLPLRSLPSELSERVVLAQELDKMIKDYIAEELNITLLFLGKLRTIEIWKVQDENKIHLATWTKSESSVEHWSKESSFSVSDVILSNGNDGFSWRIIQSRNAEDEARSRLATLVSGKTINHIFAKHKLSPDVRIAYPLFAETYTSGRLFTFLPLPSRTDFPVHIHSLFALTSSRQSLRNRNETGIVLGSDNEYAYIPFCRDSGLKAPIQRLDQMEQSVVRLLYSASLELPLEDFGWRYYTWRHFQCLASLLLVDHVR